MVPPRDLGRHRPVDAHHVMAVAVLQADQTLQQPRRQAADARVDGVDTDRSEVTEAEFDRGDREVVQRAVFEARFARRQDAWRGRWTVAKLTVPPANQGRLIGASARTSREQTADTCRIAKHLVERDR